MRRPTAWEPDRRRRAAGWSTRCWPQPCPCTRGGTARHGSADTPGRVLPGQPQHQSTDLGCRGRAATLVRVAPAASDQVLMPAQQRLGRTNNPRRGRSGQQPRESSKHGAVGPVYPRPAHLSPQHRDLVAQHQQLGVLGGRASRQQRKPPQHPGRTADTAVVGSSGDRRGQAAPPANSQLSTHNRLSGTHKLEGLRERVRAQLPHRDRPARP
jgi:hypothetical protein